MARKPVDPADNKLGALIRERRATADTDPVTGAPRELSLPDLAARMGNIVTRQMLWAVEAGTRRLTDPDALRALAHGLGNTTIEEVMAAAGYSRASEASGASDRELREVLIRSGLTEAQADDAISYVSFLKEKKNARRTTTPRARK